MDNKSILLAALKNEVTSRPAWVPFVGVHGAKLIGANAEDYLKSSELILKGLGKAVEIYNPDGLPIVFDLQLEAEVLGCELHWSDDMPPSVVSHVLKEKSLDEIQEFSTDKGRFPIIKEVIEKAKINWGSRIGLYGLITGPFTLALHLMGNNLFIEMLMNPDAVKGVLKFCTDVAIKTSNFYLRNGADIIAVVDPMTSQISTEHFSEFVAPFINEIFENIRNKKALSSLFVCGDATRNLKEMFETKCDNVSIDENISLRDVKNLSRQHNKSFGGNLKLTSVLLFGNGLDVKKHVVETIDTGGEKGFVLAPGCDLPFNCPEENLITVSQLVHDDYQREIARKLVSVDASDEIGQVDSPDYNDPNTLWVEVITLDSGSCPPCKYMVDAAESAVEGLADIIRILEYKISSREGLAHMKRMNVKSIPSICINGKLKFSSIIPDRNKLSKTVLKELKEKNYSEEKKQTND